MIHSIDIKVRGYHIDLFGHVNNARYLEFLEEARWAAFEDTVDIQKIANKGYAFTVVNITINYRRPAYMNEVLTIHTNLSKTGKRSGVIHQEVVLKDTGTIVADADVTFVLFDIKQQKAAILEGELLDMMNSLTNA